jgi:ethanolamine utilization cobalamin adenosyltransferase
LVILLFSLRKGTTRGWETTKRNLNENFKKIIRRCTEVFTIENAMYQDNMNNPISFQTFSDLSPELLAVDPKVNAIV